MIQKQEKIGIFQLEECFEKILSDFSTQKKVKAEQDEFFEDLDDFINQSICLQSVKKKEKEKLDTSLNLLDLSLEAQKPI